MVSLRLKNSYILPIIWHGDSNLKKLIKKLDFYFKNLPWNLLFILSICYTSSESANILIAIAFPGKSHWLMFEPIINQVLLKIIIVLIYFKLTPPYLQLIEKGHKITAITNFPLQTESINYRGIIIDPPWDWNSVLNMTEFFEKVSVEESTFFKITSLWNYGLQTTKFALDSPVVKNFIETDRSQYDLVITEQFQQEAFNMFAFKYNCSLISIGTLDYSDYIDRARGVLTPWSHVPHFLSYFSDNMSFIQRLKNFLYSIYDVLGRKLYYMPNQTKLARLAFKSIAKERGCRLPTIQDLESKISLHLMNSHLALSSPRPKMPGMVDIAGIHIKPPKVLPDDIKRFLDEAENGVIYMSFGSFLKSSMMSPEKYEAICNAFRSIPQRVIWKYESNNAANLPPNVLIRKWLPQNDILAHKNVRLFISHGGIFGSQESIYHEVPLIVIPFYGDQHLNGHKMVQKGIAIMESMGNLSSESLQSAINRIINNSSYYENVKKISDIFKTNENHPLLSAIWWIEYILKFKGAEHMQSSAKNLSTLEYLHLDIVFSFLISFFFLFTCFKKIYNKRYKSNNHESGRNEIKKNK
jgi:glucuronosyltransferase